MIFEFFKILFNALKKYVSSMITTESIPISSGKLSCNQRKASTFSGGLPKDENPDMLSVMADNFFLCRTEYPCWRCKKESPMYTVFLQPGYSEWIEVGEDNEAWLKVMSPAHLTYMTYLPKQVENILEEISGGQFFNDYSKAFQGYYYMNHCAHCGMKQGDGQLAEPGGAFWPRTLEELEKLFVNKVDELLVAKSKCSWLIGDFFIDFENAVIKNEIVR